jgi:hypothetical protein
MSYQLVAAKARSKGLDAVWSDVDISAMTIGSLFTDYNNVWLTLSNTALTNNVYLKLSDIREHVAAQYQELTIPQWLVINDDDTLPTFNSLPTLALRHVQYSDAWRAGYTIKPVDRFRHEDAEIPYGEKNDLLLTKEGVDFQTYHRYALVSVNGFIHRAGASTSGLQVVEGGRTGRLANNNQVGIMSFLGVGTIDCIPITPSMIYKTTEDGRLADRAYVALPYDTEGKTVLLVMGGYLHVLDEVYTKIGPKSLRINMNKIAWPERYFDSLKTIDLTSLPLTRNVNDPRHVAVDELYSDAVIKAYLSLPQSFIVIVNTSDFFVRRRQVPNSQLPGRFEVPKGTGRFPLFGAWGKLYDYAIFPDWGVHVLACNENARPRYQFRTTDWLNNATIDDSLNTYRSWDWAHGHFLEMGRFNT